MINQGKNKITLVGTVVHASNPSYLGGGNWEDRSS
jgi:hypothetical protein